MQLEGGNCGYVTGEGGDNFAGDDLGDWTAMIAKVRKLLKEGKDGQNAGQKMVVKMGCLPLNFGLFVRSLDCSSGLLWAACPLTLDYSSAAWIARPVSCGLFAP